MAVTKQSVSVLSSDGIHSLAGVVFLPEAEARGYFHVVHGMTEHMERYERLMRELAEEGWICFGYDHLGHGKTASSPDELGYIAPKNGWDLLARDVGVFFDAVRGTYGAEGLPYCLMGHSMGSFVVRLAAERYVRPDRLIVMGTGGANPAAGAGLALIGVIRRLYGDRHISKLIYRLAFGGYNKRFGGGTTEDPSPWLTSDEEVRNRYYADPFCTFKFSVSAMGDLIRLMKYSNDARWFRNISAELPILLVAGEEDPVGNYGKGVLQVERRLRRADKNVRCILYPKARHEILNEFTYERVKEDILRFCQETKERTEA